MVEVTPSNAADYLRSTDRITGPCRVELLSGGVSNVVLRVISEDGLFVLKQSCPRLRTSLPWFSDLERVYREQEVMQALYPLLPPGTVPKVLFVDRANYIFAMSHAPLEARPWKEDLLEGHVNIQLGEQVGRILGMMHEASAQKRDLFATFQDATVFTQLRVDPFYRRIQERIPDVALPVGNLIDRMLTLKMALCHGDYTPKNMLVHGQGFMLVDYETAYFGDPTMDLGLCLAHLLLKAVRFLDKRQPFQELMRSFWNGYLGTVTFQPAHELTRGAIAHLGACLLARIDGTSPVDYLDENKRDAVRNLGQKILLENICKWREIEDLISN